MSTVVKEELVNNYENTNLHHEDEIDIKEIWRIIRSYWKSIASIFIVVVLVTIYITLTTQPIYLATTTVMIKDKTTDPSSFVFDFGMTGSKQRLQNEMEVLKSYDLHNKVIQSLIDDGTADKLALFGTRYISKRYRLKDYIIDWLGQSGDSLISPEGLTSTQRIEIVEKLQNTSNVSNIRDTDVLTIGARSSDASDAVFLANRISDIYQNLDLAGGQGELHFVLTFLDSQIVKYQERLAIVENDLRQFQSDHQIYSLDGSASLMLEDLTHYESIYLKVDKKITYLSFSFND